METQLYEPPPIRKYDYRVVPFVASIGMTATSEAAAGQLQNMIQQWAANGWEYVRLEGVETHIAGNAGCFGFGAVSGRVTSCSMVVFRR